MRLELELVSMVEAASGTAERINVRLCSRGHCSNSRLTEVKDKPVISKVSSLMAAAQLRTRQLSRGEFLFADSRRNFACSMREVGRASPLLSSSVLSVERWTLKVRSLLQCTSSSLMCLSARGWALFN